MTIIAFPATLACTADTSIIAISTWTTPRSAAFSTYVRSHFRLTYVNIRLYIFNAPDATVSAQYPGLLPSNRIAQLKQALMQIFPKEHNSNYSRLIFAG